MKRVASINWTPARYVSPQASSDFIVKTVQALPRIADTTVALRRAGFTKAEIDEINAETRKVGALDLLKALNNTPDTEAEAEAVEPPGGKPAESETTNK
nr:MAG TPA: PORTAL PROTEIN [Caudoviricetes sp.]